MKHLSSIFFIALLFTAAVPAARSQTLFSVEVKGHGKPLILIHGLYCTGEVWKETVAHYGKQYECHILTLAGFGGNPPALKENFLSAVKDELIAYTKKMKLNKPVIIGHSMGGFLAFWAASSAPQLFSGVLSVDGLPFLPEVQQAGATVESSKAAALNMKNYMIAQTPEMTRAGQKMYLPMMMVDTSRMGEVAEMAAKSDPKTMGQVMYELFTTDLRPEVSKIHCPVQLQGAWIGYKSYGATHDSVLKSYQGEVATIKNATVEISDSAKHFIFYDDPTWFYAKTDSFLKGI